MEDLVPRRRARRARRRPRTIRRRPSAPRAAAAARAGSTSCVLGEVVGFVRHLAAGRRDELAHDARRCLLLGTVSCSSAPCTCSRTTARAPPIARKVESRSSLEPNARSLSQSRSRTSWRYGASTSGLGGGLVEHRLDERVFGRERLPAELAVALPRGPRIAARPSSRSRRSRRRRFVNTSGIRPVNSSSSASASSRIASRTFTREPGPSQQLGQRRAQRPVETVVEDVLLELVE